MTRLFLPLLVLHVVIAVLGLGSILSAPLTGAGRIAAFVAATAGSTDLQAEVHELNGQPALVLYHQDEPFAALLLAIANGRIHRVFFHADLERLRYLGPRTGA